MNIYKYEELTPELVSEGVERRVAHLDDLMIVLIDFYNGPTTELDKPHAHPHEQVTYVAEGEVLVEIGKERTRLGPGDVFVVPSNVPHAIQQLSEHIRLVDCFTPIRKDFIDGVGSSMK